MAFLFKQTIIIRNNIKMREVQPNELQPGILYYIESRYDFITVSPDGLPKRHKQKGVFDCILPKREEDDLEFVYFRDVENIRRSDYTNGRTDGQSYPIDLYTFYLPEKEAIEIRVANRILREVTKDPQFAGYCSDV